MAGQKPNDFPILGVLTGDEELYTQYDNIPRKFSIDTLAAFIQLSFSGDSTWNKDISGVWNSDDNIGIGLTPDINKLSVSGETNIQQAVNLGGGEVEEYSFHLGSGSLISSYNGLNYSSSNILSETILTSNGFRQATYNLTPPTNFGAISIISNSGSQIRLEKLNTVNGSLKNAVNIEDGYVQIFVTDPSAADPIIKIFKIEYAAMGNTTIDMELPTYANNIDALSGGLTLNQMYKTATGELRMVI